MYDAYGSKPADSFSLLKSMLVLLNTHHYTFALQ